MSLVPAVARNVICRTMAEPFVFRTLVHGLLALHLRSEHRVKLSGRVTQ